MRKIIKKITFIMFAVFITCFCMPALATPSHGLSPDKVKLLKALNMKIVVPGYIPAGFSVYNVSATIETESGGNGPSYNILYGSNKSNQSFCIEACSGGIGDITGDFDDIKVKSLTLGDIYMCAFKDGTKITQWITYTEKGPFYRFNTPNKDQGLYEKPISKDEAIKIIKSLKYL